MNQYIITEELANKLDDAIWHHGKYNRAELMLDVCSHPYNPQAERERVLDVLNSLYTDSLFLSDGSFECNAICDKIHGVLAEFRQKDGE